MLTRVRALAPVSFTVLAMYAVPPTDASAQQGPGAPAADSVAVHDSDLRSATLTLAILSAAGAAALPLDEHIRGWFQRPGVQGNGVAGQASRLAENFGGYAPLVMGGATYLTAELFGRNALADATLHTTEAALLALGSTMVIKALAGRQRPYAGLGSYVFELGDGTETRDQRSFPSGHATTIFALAAGLSSEARHWWPEHGSMVAAVLYPVAGLTALSRVYDDQHWTSDTLVGAGVGIFVASWLSQRKHSGTPEAGARLRGGAAPFAGERVGLWVTWSHGRARR